MNGFDIDKVRKDVKLLNMASGAVRIASVAKTVIAVASLLFVSADIIIMLRKKI